MPLYGVNAQDGFAQDFECESDAEALREAIRILTKEQAYPVDFRFEVWATESDTLIFAMQIDRTA